MNTEADLAAVLAHEIGHITARHGVQQQARGTLARTAAQVGGVVTAVATGSSYVGSQISEVASIWAQTGLSGFGREHELEADSLGAEYIKEAGYDPVAMINVVTVLKNQEDFSKRVNNGGGGYHGLFATHPRNDTRLQEAIAAVASLDNDEILNLDNTEFRENIKWSKLGSPYAGDRGSYLGESSSTNSDSTGIYLLESMSCCLFPISESTSSIIAWCLRVVVILPNASL